MSRVPHSKRDRYRALADDLEPSAPDEPQSSSVRDACPQRFPVQTHAYQPDTRSDLESSTRSGVKWNFASQGGQQITQLLTTIVLARLLVPADFGLLGMATVVIGLVSMFKDLGTAAAVIQAREPTGRLLSSVFWANVTFGCLGAGFLILIAPYVATFYHQPRMTAILRVLALNFAISGFSILQQALFERKLHFRALARVEMTGVLAGGIIGITYASAGGGVWALVAQSITSTTCISLLLWRLSDWRPRMLFCWAELRRVAGFSLNLTGFNVFNYVVRNADYLLIGRFLGAAPLGIYTLAYRIMLYPLQSVTTVIGRVMFPVYSKLQDDDERFRTAYISTAGIIAVITFPLMIGVCVLADPLIHAVFGAKWMGAVPLIRILAPIGMMQSVAATVGAIYQAKGRTDTLFRWGVFTGLLSVSAFLIGLHWGIIGVATAYAILSALLVLPNFIIPFRFIHLRLRQVGVVLMRPVVASLLMAVGILLLRAAIARSPHAVVLGASIATGCALYGVASWTMNRDQLCAVLALVGWRP